MSEVAGNVAEVRINTTEMTDSSGGAKVEGVDSHTLNRLAEILDISQYGTNYRNRMAGIKDSNVSLSGNYDPADTTGQGVIEPGDSVWVAIFPQGTSESGRQIEMIVENFEESGEVGGKITFSSSLQGIGAPASISAAA